jgi:hypothetical protein
MESSALIGQAQSSWLIFRASWQPQLTELKSLNMIQTNRRLIGTQNTSSKMPTRRNKTTSQFLIGTEMRLFGVLCRPEAEPGDLWFVQLYERLPSPKTTVAPWLFAFAVNSELSTLNCL